MNLHSARRASSDLKFEILFQLLVRKFVDYENCSKYKNVRTFSIRLFNVYLEVFLFFTFFPPHVRRELLGNVK